MDKTSPFNHLFGSYGMYGLVTQKAKGDTWPLDTLQPRHTPNECLSRL